MTTIQDTRWGTGTRADSHFAREQILDAAYDCYLSIGIAKTTVEHVAREAKVSRTTIYRYFKNRDEVLTAVVLRESHALLEAVKLALADIDDLGEFLVEAMVLTQQEASKLPLHELLFGHEGAALTSRLCISSEEIAVLGTTLIQPLYEKARERGKIPQDMSVWHIIEWVARLLLSYWTTPSPLLNGPDEYRQMLRLFLLPTFHRQSVAPSQAPA